MLYGPSVAGAHDDSHDMCSPVSAANSGCRRTSVLTLPRKASKGQKNCPITPGCQVLTCPFLLVFLGPLGLPPLSAPLRRRPLQLSPLPPPPASPVPRPPPHPLEPPRQPLSLKSLQVVSVSLGVGGGNGEGTSLSPTSELCPQLLSQWARRSCLRTGSPTQRSSAAAACRSWSPRLPTDTTPVLPLPPLS